MTKKYTIGIDYGTESGRVLLVDVSSGEEVATHVTPYRHGVLDKKLPNGLLLKTDWALQHPQDYLEVLYQSVPEVLQAAQVEKEDIIGIGIDFTASTILPLDKEGFPLCFDKKWESNPHSWVKLWKHHAAQNEADEITEHAIKREESFLDLYGGKISSEWVFPKILQIVKEAPDIFEATDLFMEACDWLIYQLTQNLLRSSNTSGYKAFWHKNNGFPDNSFFKTLHPSLNNIVETKMRGEVRSIGEKAGELTEEMAQRLGLLPGTAVAVGIIDAHAGVPAVGAVHPGQMVMALGTSTCHMLISDREEIIDGVCGVVEDGIIPGYYSYETGQVAVGDSFAWFVEHAVPDYIVQQAKESGKNVHEILEEKARVSNPGESGLVALDWWNGNRSVLVDADLSGLIVGLTLTTKPEEIYRALLESTAFGTRKVIESYVQAEVAVNEIFAVGGLPQRNKMLMQIYADVLNREIKVAESVQTTAIGAAMYAAVAAGKRKGGFDTIFEAAEKMAKVKKEKFVPIQKNVDIYNKLYEYYEDLHDYFGRNNYQLMHSLKEMRVLSADSNHLTD